MNYLRMVLSPLISISFLFILTKIRGPREVGQLSMFDYINSITIGSIAADAAVGELSDLPAPLIAMAIYTLVTFGLSWITNKSRPARALIDGQPMYIIEKGKFKRETMSKLKLDLDEFLMLVRSNGYFDVSKLDCVIMEPNGKLSILVKSTDRPATTSDMSLTVAQDEVFLNVICDGRVMTQALTELGFNEVWLTSELDRLGTSADKVYLAVCDSNGSLTVYDM